jgi:predicted secreted Zn-dependent protease
MSTKASRRRTAPTALAVVLVAILTAGCAQSAPSATPTTPSAAPPAPTAASSQVPATFATPQPTASPAAELRPIAGTWRVRKVLARDDRSGLIGDRTFDEETYTIAVGCDAEPCDTIQLTTTPLGLVSPAKTTTLTRAGAVYTSTDPPAEASDCHNFDEDRVAGGATATTRLKIWIATDRPAGTSVALTVLKGQVDLDVKPTSIGESAGCEPQAASFDLSGRREEVAVRDPNGPTQLNLKPPKRATYVRLPKLSAPVADATVHYFAIDGDTSIELALSIARGGSKACGAIDYEWFRGDARPSACTITFMTDVEESIRTKLDASGTCTIASASFQSRYVINMPRWTAPPRVPKRLLDWWRRIVAFIATHEAEHVRIGRDYIKKLNTRLTGIDCAGVDEIVQAWAKQHAAAQEAFDRSEYSKPWPQPAAGY